jgi:ubiquitin carboxyl-terminal hydrolase 9/24
LDQLALIATKCSLTSDVLVKFIELLYSHLSSTVDAHFETSNEFFQLFCRLLNSAASSGCSLPLAQDLLEFEIDLIQNVRTKLVRNGLIEEIQLEGHLGITKEIISFYNPETKHSIGCDPTGRWASASGKAVTSRGLIKCLMDEYIFPASRAMVVIQRHKNVHIEEINPICSSPATLSAAFDVLVALCTGCINNLQVVSQTLTDMFYTEEADHNLEWEYLPPVGPRPSRGFVGLKNAGATCYMNSVLQQVSSFVTMSFTALTV